MRDENLQCLNVGRNCGPEKWRVVESVAIGHRRGVELSDERLVRVRTAIEQEPNQIQRGQLVRIVGTQARTVESKLVRC
jgi:hypothetical protein